MKFKRICYRTVFLHGFILTTVALLTIALLFLIGCATKEVTSTIFCSTVPKKVNPSGVVCVIRDSDDTDYITTLK